MAYECINEDCSEVGQSKEFLNVTTKFKDGEVLEINSKTKKELICEVCKKKLKLVSSKGKFNVMYGKFSSATPEQKKEILKKRAWRNRDKEVEDYTKAVDNEEI